VDYMGLHHPITRRESIKKLLHLSGSLALARFVTGPVNRTLSAWAGAKETGFIVEGVGEKEGYSTKQLIKEVFDAVGGMGRLVSKGDVVVIKPNISWARPPHLGATTNPEVLQGVIELCQEAGAKKVRVADNTINDATLCFTVTGAETVAKETGAELIYPGASLMREMKLGGDRLDVWPVFVPLVEADKVLNLPVAKHHVLSSLTLGMKNWIGGVGGRRGGLHQEIHQNIVDLAQFFKPTVTLIDATRIMIRNGPTGGSTSDVAEKNTLILSNDQVAADAKASSLFGKRPQDIRFIRLAQKWGLGTADFSTLLQKQVRI
jgi:uncharacterized protein (DUF362 family)